MTLLSFIASLLKKSIYLKQKKSYWPQTFEKYIYITFACMHLADAFIQSDLQCIFVSMCVPWELNPQPFALLTQYSTTEQHAKQCINGIRIHFLALTLCQLSFCFPTTNRRNIKRDT